MKKEQSCISGYRGAEVKSDRLIWILEDFEGCQFVYKKALDDRYNLRFFSRIDMFLNALKSNDQLPDLVIADITLEDGSFFDLFDLPRYRKMLSFPFIVISSMADKDTLRFGYKNGALDYLLKPFKKTELIVKIEQAFIRSGVVISKESILDNENLTKKEKKIIKVLLDADGDAVCREEILEQVWNDQDIATKTLDVHIHNLRRKISEFDIQIINEGISGWSLSFKE